MYTRPSLPCCCTNWSFGKDELGCMRVFFTHPDMFTSYAEQRHGPPGSETWEQNYKTLVS